MTDSTRPLERCVFKWDIKNPSTCLIFNKGMKSPVFQLWSPTSSWNLEVNVCEANQIQIRLCRHFMQGGPPKIKTRFLLCLKTLHETEIWRNDSGWLYFEEGSIRDSKFVPVPLIFDSDDTMVVMCDMFFSVDGPRYFVDPYLNHLLPDLQRISNNNGGTESTNSTLIVGKQEKSINVNKDILSAHSTQFRRFSNLSRHKFNIKNCSPKAIQSMINYLHSMDITTLAYDKNIFELWPCALELGVSCLIDLLRPEFLFRTSEFFFEERMYKWRYKNFSQTLRSGYVIDTGLQAFQFVMLECCIQFKITMYVYVAGNDDTTRCQTLFDIEIWNVPKVYGFIMRMSVCDNEDCIHIGRVELIKPSSDGAFRFHIWIENEVLFGTGNSFPRHFEFKLGFKQDLTEY